ncbi:hypothetical protein Dimus_031141 [Dionaea muscipula]
MTLSIFHLSITANPPFLYLSNVANPPSLHLSMSAISPFLHLFTSPYVVAAISTILGALVGALV